MELKNLGAQRGEPLVFLQSGESAFTLPMPDDMSSSLPITWDQIDFGVFKDYAHGGGESVYDSASATATVDQIQRGAGHIAKKMGWSLVAGSRGRGINERRAGAILNANKEMLFKGANFRNFTFTWTILPKNADIARDTHFLVREFQKSSVGTLDNNSRMVKYPESWIIVWQDAKLPDIKDCVITNVSANYGTGGKVILHQDGFPVQTVVSVTFVELTVMTSDDFPWFGG